MQKKLLLVLGLLACGETQKPDAKRLPTLDEAVEKSLVDAIAKHDVAAVTGFLKAPLAYGGLWFADPDCAQQFPATLATIEAERIFAFATCLTTLPLAMTVHGQKALLTYEPGIEVDLKYTFDGQHAFIVGIGHVSDQGESEARIVPTAAKLIEGAKYVVPDDEDKVTLQKSTLREKKVVGSFKVCFDKQGAVQRVVVLKNTGLSGYDRKITKTLSANRYQPVAVGTQILDVCTALTFIYTQR